MKEQRKKEILDFLNKQGRSTISELAEKLSVSESTVRRDLKELSRSNHVVLRHDGVLPLSQEHYDKTVHHRSSVNARSKAMLSRAAVKFIDEGFTVFLDSSSTVLAMTDLLRSFKSITVVTNSLSAVRNLRGCGYPVYFIGGEISPRSNASYGPVAELSLRHYNFDIAFFSPVAITRSNYVAETTENAAAVRRVAMEQSACSVLLCDHTKIGLSKPFNIAHLDSFDYLLTDDTKHVFDSVVTVRRIKE